MAKASTSKVPAAKRDPLDHDGDGKKGGSLPKAKRQAAQEAAAEAPAGEADGTLPDPIIDTQPPAPAAAETSDPMSAVRGQEPVIAATRIAGVMSKTVPAKVELPDVTPDLAPSGALLEVIKAGPVSRLVYANGAVREHRVR